MSDECQSFRDAIANLAQKEPRSDGKILTVREYADPIDPTTGEEDNGKTYEIKYVDPKSLQREVAPKGYRMFQGENGEEIYEVQR